MYWEPLSLEEKEYLLKELTSPKQSNGTVNEEILVNISKSTDGMAVLAITIEDKSHDIIKDKVGIHDLERAIEISE